MFEIEDTVYMLTTCYFKLHDHQSYIDTFTKYVQMFPSASWAFANLGRALLEAKDYKGAFLRLSTAKRLGHWKSVDVELAHARKMLRKDGPLKNKPTLTAI